MKTRMLFLLVLSAGSMVAVEPKKPSGLTLFKDLFLLAVDFAKLDCYEKEIDYAWLNSKDYINYCCEGINPESVPERRCISPVCMASTAICCACGLIHCPCATVAASIPPALVARKIYMIENYGGFLFYRRKRMKAYREQRFKKD